MSPKGPTRLVRGYLGRRGMELATPATRAINDPLAEWAVKRIRLDSKPFSFRGHEYLRAIYDDRSSHVILSKAAQIGGTTWAILRAFHACLQGLNVGYYFPTLTDVRDFSRSRVGPLLGDNPFLADAMRDTDTVGLKRIGDANLYFRGMKSSVGMKSVPLDMIVFDELDEATPDARAMAWERIAHSDYKRVIELSNPSLPGYGIDEQFEKSDQRHWTLRCPACGKRTSMEREFPAKLGEDVKVILPRGDGTYYRACPACSAELDLDQGEWVADFPDRSTHGYRISQLFSSTVDPGEILEEYRSTRYPERFYNLKIGIPWADLERRLDTQTVLALCRTEDPPTGFHVLGVDTGKELHAVVLRTTGFQRWPAHVVHLEACSTFEDLDRLMHDYQIRRCVIDALPETHATRDFARRWRDRVFMSFFSETQRGSPRWDRDQAVVSMNRTEALDASRAVVREHKLTLPPRNPAVDLFAQHMSCDAKVLEEDEETGAKRFKYVRTGADHYSLALTYAVLAMQGMPMPMTPAQREQLRSMAM